MTALIAPNKLFIRNFVSGGTFSGVSETLSVSKVPVLFVMKPISIFLKDASLRNRESISEFCFRFSKIIVIHGVVFRCVVFIEEFLLSGVSASEASPKFHRWNIIFVTWSVCFLLFVSYNFLRWWRFFFRGWLCLSLLSYSSYGMPGLAPLMNVLF